MTRGRIIRTLAGVLITNALLLGAGQPAGAFHEIVVLDDSPGNQGGSRTDGTFVIWGAEPSWTSYDIYGARLDDPKPFAVATGPASQQDADIDDGIVVWQERLECCGQFDVRGMDLQTGTTFDIAVTDADEGHAKVSGDLVAWSHFDESGISFWARDISQVRTGGAPGEPFLVYDFPDEASVGAQPFEFDGDRFVWIEEGAGIWGWELYTMSLREGFPRYVTAGTSVGRGSRGYDVAGDLIVYLDSGANPVAYDYATGEQTIIQGGGGYDLWPSTDGRYVFWLMNYEGSSLQLLGYDLLTNSRFTVTDQVDSVHSIHVDTGVLTWSRGAESEADVYAAPITDVLPSARRPAPGAMLPNQTYFPETGHTLGHGFKAFWDRNGGLPVFGYPLTEEYGLGDPLTSDLTTIQIFERQRFEWHPENTGTAYDVLLGRLGAEDATRRGLLNTQPFQPIDVIPASTDCRLFTETGHSLCGAIQSYWHAHGLDLGDDGVSDRESLALFGYPISEPFVDAETGLTVQYFERAVFELHPENTGTEYEVLLRRLGAEELVARGWS